MTDTLDDVLLECGQQLLSALLLLSNLVRKKSIIFPDIVDYSCLFKVTYYSIIKKKQNTNTIHSKGIRHKSFDLSRCLKISTEMKLHASTRLQS